MSVSEFELIESFFSKSTVHHRETQVGIGDDCAIIGKDADSDLAITTDTLVEGVHFFSDVDPESLGHKSLAVSLSDLAGVGAEPKWATLALTLPESNPDWLSAFSRGFFSLAQRFSIELIGGDTTQGPLAVNVQALGLLPKSTALLRNNARAGDKIFVTGTLGDAGLALAKAKSIGRIDDENLIARLTRPVPRVEMGRALRSLAHSCIDISDGLYADLGHILRASRVGATIDCKNLPLSAAMAAYIGDTGDYRIPLCAGDDYELCFTIDPENLTRLAKETGSVDCPYTCIGEVESAVGLRVAGNRNRKILDGYEHFS